MARTRLHVTLNVINVVWPFPDWTLTRLAKRGKKQNKKLTNSPKTSPRGQWASPSFALLVYSQKHLVNNKRKNKQTKQKILNVFLSLLFRHLSISFLPPSLSPSPSPPTPAAAALPPLPLPSLHIRFPLLADPTPTLHVQTLYESHSSVWHGKEK